MSAISLPVMSDGCCEDIQLPPAPPGTAESANVVATRGMNWQVSDALGDRIVMLPNDEVDLKVVPQGREPAWLRSAIQRALAPLEARVEALHSRFDAIHSRLGAMESRLHAMDNKVESGIGNIGEILGNLGGVADKLDAMSDNLASITEIRNKVVAETSRDFSRLAALQHNDSSAAYVVVPFPDGSDPTKAPHELTPLVSMEDVHNLSLVEVESYCKNYYPEDLPAKSDPIAAIFTAIGVRPPVGHFYS